MAVSSTMLALGTQAPDFKLRDTVSGDMVALGDFDGTAALLVMFICNHCPYVKHVRHGLADLGRDYADADVSIVAISANDVGTHPQDSPDNLKKQAAEQGFAFPYLYDESQDAARAYSAACTPDFFLFDGERKLVYRGQLDDSRPDNGRPLSGVDLRAALDAVIAGSPVSANQKPSIGCNIKWRSE